KRLTQKENNILLIAVEQNPYIATRIIQDDSKLETLIIGFNFATRLEKRIKSTQLPLLLYQNPQSQRNVETTNAKHRKESLCRDKRQVTELDAHWLSQIAEMQVSDLTKVSDCCLRGVCDRKYCLRSYDCLLATNGSIIGTYVIGSVETTNGTYLQFLQNKLPNLLEDVDLRTHCRTSRLITIYLNEKFHEDGLSYIKVSYVKVKVFARQLTTYIADMKLRIKHAFQDINDDTLQRVENKF
ncbi:hypothetical protein X777_06628, partial [Ooceraea biroi]